MKNTQRDRQLNFNVNILSIAVNSKPDISPWNKIKCSTCTITSSTIFIISILSIISTTWRLFVDTSCWCRRLFTFDLPCMSTLTLHQYTTLPAFKQTHISLLKHDILPHTGKKLSQIFNTTPVLYPTRTCHERYWEKTRMMGLLSREMHLMICSATLTWLMRVT